MENIEESVYTEKNIEENVEIREDIKDENVNDEDIDNNEFNKIIEDFLNDIKISFPELNDEIKKYYNEDNSINFKELHEYCCNYYPNKFFDIINSNDDIMKEGEDNYFLPEFSFDKLFVEDVSDNTKETVWKYLKLILFNVIGNLKDKNVFGDTAKLFEGVDANILKEKMEETMKGLHELFASNDDSDDDNENNEEKNDNDNKKPDFLDAENMQEHISKLLEGKLGKLASEIAAETVNDLGIDMEDPENAGSLNDVMKNMLSNPGKIMDLVKKVGGKLDDKIKSGEIKESELLAEAGDLMKNMKKMPGAKDINKMMKSMGMDLGSLGGLAGLGGGKGTKFNTGAMKSHLKKKQMQERIREKAINKVKQREEEERVQKEFEEKSKEFLKTTNVGKEKSIEDLLKELDITDNNESSVNKKKKKKSKK